jgi:hypothetical protein
MRRNGVAVRVSWTAALGESILSDTRVHRRRPGHIGPARLALSLRLIVSRQLITHRSVDMATMDDELVRGLESEIKAYLKLHPHAADSIDGIRSWWLDPRHKVANEEQLQRALSGLVRQGIMHRTELPDGHVIYRGEVD